MSSFNYNIVTIDGYHYTQHPVTKDLSPLKAPIAAPPSLLLSDASSDGRFRVVVDGNNLLTVDTLTGEVIRTLYPQKRDCLITKAQLDDAYAQELVAGTVVFKAKRAKRKVVNLYGSELMGYRLNDEERFFVLLKAITAADKTLTSEAGKLNFSFRDLGRICCMDEFTSDHLYSFDRGNEYTMAAYRATLDKFVTLCRESWRGQSLAPEYELAA